MQPPKVAEKEDSSGLPETTRYAAHVHFPEFMQTCAEGTAKAKMRDNPMRRARFFHVTQMLELTRGVAGYTAECGVFRGLASYLICNTLRREMPMFKGESHFMVDSFEGLSVPAVKDGSNPEKRHAEGAFTRTSVEDVRQTMEDFPDVNIIKGWIPEVLAELPEQKYRFTHIDVDLYEPTLDCFRYFWPRMSVGGIMMCDDFGPWDDNDWPGCIKAVNEFASEVGAPYANLNTGNVVFIKR